MLAEISSIATLILFVIYFSGRVITICRTRSIFEDDIKVDSLSLSSTEYDIIEYVTLNKNPYNTCLLTSKQGIYSVTIYSILRVGWNAWGIYAEILLIFL